LVHRIKGYDELLTIVVLIDKYICKNILRYWFRSQLHGLCSLKDNCFDANMLAREGFMPEQMLYLGYTMDDLETFDWASTLFYSQAAPDDMLGLLEPLFASKNGLLDRLLGPHGTLLCKARQFTDLIPELLQAFSRQCIRRLAAIGLALLEHVSGQTQPFDYLAKLPQDPDTPVDDSDRNAGQDVGLCAGRAARYGFLHLSLRRLVLLTATNTPVNDSITRCHDPKLSHSQ
jgi:hypothetical protein